MEFINHTLTWCRGEIFEGRMYFLFGLVILLIALAFWKWGTSPNARGVIIPFAVVAVFSIAGGLTLNFNNQNRIIKYQKEYTANAEQFIHKEKERTEAFMKWYPYTLFGMAGLMIIGLVLFLFLDSANGKGIGLGLIFLGFSIIFLDHFSEERANIYHQKIIEVITK
jgi:ABC-type transport system involved in cytochrome c biogenesis permease subunit